MNRAIIPILLALLLGWAVQANAESKALIIGVGNYNPELVATIPKVNLRGIDIDVTNMKVVAKSLGFAESQIKTLLDSQATLNAIKQGLAWAASGVGAQDRVLVYFSGHGSYISDPSSSSDEPMNVLTPYDTRYENGTLVNVLKDREFGAMLSKIPAKETFVLVDACESATATSAKGMELLDSTDEVKFLRYPGVENVIRKNRSRSAFSEDDGDSFVKGTPGQNNWNWTALSAAQNDEPARPSANGSIFTNGVVYGIEQGTQQGPLSTMNALKDISQRYIEKQLPRDQVHHPQITGNKQMAAVNLFAKGGSGLSAGSPPPPPPSGNSSPGDPWSDVQSLVAAAGYRVELSLNKSTFAMGEAMVITCNVPQEGYLNVVNVSKETGEVTLIYPNKFTNQNHVSKGRVQIPEPGATFALNAVEAGKSLVAVFVTKESKNLLKNFDPTMQALFPTLDAKTPRGAFGAVGTQGSPQAGQGSDPQLRDIGAGAAIATIK